MQPLDPYELLWNHTKRTDNDHQSLQKGEELNRCAATQFTEIGRNPKLMCLFFKHPNAAYISDL